MLTVLLATRHSKRFQPLIREVQARQPADFTHAIDGRSALHLASCHPVDLAIVDDHMGDMTGLDLARQLIMVNANISTALVSSESPDAFHELTEGLGIATQLPRNCGSGEAALIMDCLRKLGGLPGQSSEKAIPATGKGADDHQAPAIE